MSNLADNLTHSAEPADIGSRLPEGIRQQLLYFYQLRRSLRLVSGMSAWLVVSAIVLLASVLLDALWTAPIARSAASCLFYAATLLAAWLLVIRVWMHRSLDWLAEASVLQQRSGRLRNLLVSAVELASTSLPPGTSKAFTARVQDDAEEAIVSLDVRETVSQRPRRVAIRRTQITCGLLIIGCLLPWIHLPNRIGRVLFPMANFGRNSWVTIQLTQPLPHNKNIAQGDVVVVVAEFFGPWEGKAQLETRTIAGSDASVMVSVEGSTATAENLAKATISTTERSVEYRVTSQNAATPWYRLDASPRPQLDRITAEVLPPGAGPDAQGFIADLAAGESLRVLRGSSVRLRATSEFSLAVAQLQWQLPRRSTGGQREDQDGETIELLDEAGKLSAEFVADRSRRFKMHLVDATTALSNPFSKVYEVEVVEDSPAELTWLSPEATDHLVAPDEIVGLELVVADQLPLRSTAIQYRINKGDWRPVPSVSQQAEASRDRLGATETLAASVDFTQLGARYGDLVEFEGTARDAADNQSRSRTLRMTIVAQRTQPLLGPSEQMQFEIADRIDQFADKLDGYSLGPARQSLRAQELVTGFQSDLQQLIAFTLSSAGGLDSPECQEALGFVGSNLTHVNGHLAVYLSRLQAVAVDSPDARGDIRRIADDLRTMTSDFREVLAVRVGRSIAAAIRQLAGAQNQIAERAAVLSGADGESQLADGPNALALARMQRAVFYQLENVQLLIADASSNLPENSAQRLAQVARSLDSAASGVRREVGNANLRSLQHNATVLSNYMLQASRTQGIFPDWTGRLNRHLGLLAKRAAASTASLDLARSIATSGGPSHSHLSDAFSLGYQVTRAFRRATHPGDGLLSSDMGLAHRAALTQSEALAGQPLADRFRQIHAAAQALLAASIAEQASHSFVSTNDAAGARNVASVEGEYLDHGDDHLLAWCVAAGSIPAASENLGLSGYSHDLTQQLVRVAGRMQDGLLQHYFSPQRSPDIKIGDNFPEAQTRFLRVASGLENARGPLQKQAEKARAVLRSLAPSVVDLAKSAAEQARQLSLLTGDLAGATERDTAASVQAEVQQLASELTRPAEATEMLRDALIDLAESQDLLAPNQIETAKQADAAREQVDVASEQLNNSLNEIDSSRTDGELAEQLRAGAEKQLAAAERLEQVAQQLADALPESRFNEAGSDLAANSASDAIGSLPPNLSSSTGATENAEGNATQGAGSSSQPGDPSSQSSGQQSGGQQPNSQASSNVDANDATSQTDAYEAAEQLAEFAAQSPEEMLAELEEYLPSSSPMQRELSNISRRAAEEALAQVQMAEQQLDQLSTELHLSDIGSEVASQEMLLDATYANAILRDIGIQLLDQSRAAMSLAKEDAAARSLASLKAKLAASLEKLRQQQAAIRSPNEAAVERLPENLAGWLDTQLDIAKKLTETAAQQLERAAQLKNKKIHLQPRDLKNATQDASDRLRRTTQLLSRVSRGHQRQRTQQLQQIERLANSLQDDINRREKSSRRPPDSSKENTRRWQATERYLQRDRKLLAELELLAERMKSKVKAAGEQVAAANSIATLEGTENPAAELAERLWTELERTSRSVVEQLDSRSPTSQPVAIAEATLSRFGNVPSTSASQIRAAADSLDRAVRHERRLGSERHAEQLAEIVATAQQLAIQNGTRTQAAFNSALSAASTSSTAPGEVPTAESAKALDEIEAMKEQTERLAEQLASFLDKPPTEPQSKASMVKPPAAMQPDELAHLLDQLDRQLNQGRELGESDNDSDAASSLSSSQPQQLSKSASQIAQSLAMGRQTPSEQTSGDLAMATESQQADVRPQGPTAVQMLDVQRINGNWGQLRERTNEDALEDARLSVPAQYRSQVDAYFRQLGTAARPEANNEK